MFIKPIVSDKSRVQEKPLPRPHKRDVSASSHSSVKEVLEIQLIAMA